MLFIDNVDIIYCYDNILIRVLFCVELKGFCFLLVSLFFREVKKYIVFIDIEDFVVCFKYYF